MIAGFNKQLEFYVWGDGLTRFGTVGRIAAGILRNLWAVLRDIMSGQLTLRAMSLVYTTLLSIVPLIAVSFSVLKGFGVHKELEKYLYGVLEPLGAKGVEITDQVMALVNSVNGSVLGGIGLAFFVYTAISMVQKIEESFNYVWYVTKPRSFATRVVEYSTVLIVGTLAVGIAVRTIASFGEEDLVVSMQESSVPDALRRDHRDLLVPLQVHAQHERQAVVGAGWRLRRWFSMGIYEQSIRALLSNINQSPGHLCQFRHRNYNAALAIPELAHSPDRFADRVLFPEPGIS